MGYHTKSQRVLLFAALTFLGIWAHPGCDSASASTDPYCAGRFYIVVPESVRPLEITVDSLGHKITGYPCLDSLNSAYGATNIYKTFIHPSRAMDGIYTVAIVASSIRDCIVEEFRSSGCLDDAFKMLCPCFDPFDPPPCEPAELDIDILPGQCPNVIPVDPIQLPNVIRPSAAYASAPGRLAAAIVGSNTLDVTTIHTSWIQLEGVPPVTIQIRDVTSPPTSGETPCECTATDLDGYPDLVAQFDVNAILAVMARASCTSSVAKLTGELRTGEPIIGSDCLTINPFYTIRAGIERSEDAPLLELSNSPNPFNATTTISYTLPVESEVRIDVFDVLGRRVATLVRETQNAGPHQITWTGRAESGKAMSSGIYFARMTAGGLDATVKMTLLK